ncbi:hypothetical protein COU54_04605 [Candidatus Pacearchaeota archaeon CG10_big_fil_rev_8_21_14_0_10_31_24]|nr:MAG: hypothetical protein COU54_04605 [Candidatus Pacearchaeota archaeon CG10_big_fil_rev_8_21_14_0_10_31_24]
MTAKDEINRMQAEGKSDAEIVNALKSLGYSQQEIYDSLGQSKIKSAVSGSQERQPKSFEPQNSSATTESSEGMQPSLLNPQSAPETNYSQGNSPGAEEYQENYTQYQEPTNYQQNAPQQQYNYQDTSYSPGTDTIAEISEQIVNEKLHNLKQDIEKIIDFKNSIDSKIEHLDERLKRIEKILDKLQLSILQKVGEYMSNVSDLKTELQETQKSFNAISSKSIKKE